MIHKDNLLPLLIFIHFYLMITLPLVAAVWPAILLDDKNDNDKVTNVCEE